MVAAKRTASSMSAQTNELEHLPLSAAGVCVVVVVVVVVVRGRRRCFCCQCRCSRRLCGQVAAVAAQDVM